MAAVTQVIPNYIGGVSSQPDERKLPGQVTEATNAYIDATFGLTKRQGAQFLTTLDDYTDDDDPLEGASWFFISRDDDAALHRPVSSQFQRRSDKSELERIPMSVSSFSSF